MNLYEVTTGYTRCSYERAYVWASSEGRALELFSAKHPSREAKRIELLVSWTDEEFVTELDDEGFVRVRN